MQFETLLLVAIGFVFLVLNPYGQAKTSQKETVYLVDSVRKPVRDGCMSLAHNLWHVSVLPKSWKQGSKGHTASPEEVKKERMSRVPMPFELSKRPKGRTALAL